MKLKYVVTLVLFVTVSSSSLTAQNKTKNFIGISSGLSVPLGVFSKTDVGVFGNWNNKTGFAKTGFTIGVEGAYYVLPKIGIGGVLNFSDHGILSKRDAQKLGDSYTDAFAVNYTTVYTSKRYQNINLLIGPYFSFPFHKITIDLRAMGGLIKSTSTPEISVQLEDDPTNVFIQKSSTAFAIGGQLGLGCRYALSDKIALSLRGDCFHTGGIKVKNENRSNNAGRLVTKQEMTWINASLGIAYSFGK